MPTGYTADIAKGITFQQFAMNCARAFGALVAMRDEPSDAPIPERFEPSDYHSKKLVQLRDRLATLRALSADDAEKGAQAAHEAELASHQKYIEEKADLRSKYEAMLRDAQDWQPPTPEHEPLKKFMIEQIESSIGFDCDTSYYKAPESTPAAKWLEDQLRGTLRDIDYHEKEHAKEVERTNSRNAWLAALRSSLAPVSAEVPA
jgi:hypothetical protein